MCVSMQHAQRSVVIRRVLRAYPAAATPMNSSYIWLCWPVFSREACLHARSIACRRTRRNLARHAKPLAMAMSPLLWGRHKPDLFDSYSLGRYKDCWTAITAFLNRMTV